jgi:HJR/Mrr/RecB family endonuclease
MDRAQWLKVEQRFRMAARAHYALRAAQCAGIAPVSEEYGEKATIYAELASTASEPNCESFRRVWSLRSAGWNDTTLPFRLAAGSARFPSVQAYVDETIGWTETYRAASEQSPINTVDELRRIEILTDDTWAQATSLDLAVYGLYLAWHPDSLFVVPDRRKDLRTMFEADPNTVRALSPRQFEEFIAYLLEVLGCRVQLTKQSRDFGADILAWHSGPLGGQILTAIQVKQYAGHRAVGLKEVYELHGAVAHYRADLGQLVTTSRFTKSAETFAATQRIDLVDFNRLHTEFMRLFNQRSEI